MARKPIRTKGNAPIRGYCLAYRASLRFEFDFCVLVSVKMKNHMVKDVPRRTTEGPLAVDGSNAFYICFYIYVTYQLNVWADTSSNRLCYQSNHSNAKSINTSDVPCFFLRENKTGTRSSSRFLSSIIYRTSRATTTRPQAIISCI